MATTQEQQNAIENKILSITKDYLKSMGRTQSLSKVSLTASLDKDIGVDSLGRVELFHRIETAFGVNLAEKTMLEANTLSDLITAVCEADPETSPKQGPIKHEAVASQYDPSQAKSLVQILIERGETEPDQIHVTLRESDGTENIIRYGQLLKESSKVAAGLQALGITTGDTVAIMLPTSQDFFYAFMGCQLIGAIPVPIYPPLRPSKIEEYALRAQKILNNAEARLLITFDQAEKVAKLLHVFVKSLKTVTTLPQLQGQEIYQEKREIKTNFPGLIQYTSGSTHDPKGVLLSHEQLLNNIRAVDERIHFSPQDVGVSWLPLYHDMGLIGTWLNALYHALPLVVMSPLTFLNRPESWLWAIHYHRGTLSAGPNFAYELCVQKIDPKRLVGLDLSSWRLSFNGAEAINPKTLQKFIQKFEPFGFDPKAMYPAYGLAETCVALSLPPLNEGPKIDRIDRKGFEQEQIAKPTDSAQALSFVSCGLPLKNHHIRIVGSDNQVLPERQIGSIQFKGPSTMSGYYRQIEATNAIKHGEWLETGDLGYLADGQIYVTGRKKDIIIKAGRNLYPIEIEEQAQTVDGIRKGCVVAFGVNDDKTATEKLVVVAETKVKDADHQKILQTEIQNNIQENCDIVPDEILLIAPRVIPKTSSGKLQRSLCKQMYLNQELGKRAAPLSGQIIKMVLKALMAKCQSVMTFMLLAIYNIYVYIIMGVSWALFAILALMLPGKALHWVLKHFTKGMMFCLGCPIFCDDPLEKKRDPSVIFIANHASYIDAIVLLATLPIETRFIAKKELMQVPILKTILRKLGAMTVDRVDAGKNIADVKKISDALKEKQAILIFPEGTFTRHSGILPFKMGAFKLAVERQIPLCPVGIEGARRILRDSDKYMRPGKIHITYGALLVPQTQGWDEAVRLQQEARKQISMLAKEQPLDL